ncbi:MAG TPA: tRNA (adenosine(37)-N6)-threonylcarbamoyltransferase complex ATPase subunit type 1 TsaE [Tenuifilaceae bacterium]|nr:tRNA (adenosine(37)-N6)-threonylcarbamoyltransferase complex ATPase subunit type 1 TsaE [Tenuifilaceae bacterium]HPE18901.1 tRNA (adenosine(37)-N6)-threonylcarbamoyltransferase complex ATPase subunit type 1 TsaE [Tenuifilaceae bacterium]HPJ45122.1 tRNA (adenosine(37)-N6)-threonylcarbamoyltransferase complex ATPase subunit type 1 TsaE [Tenuifilaceae bacterium]HPQ33722.1 tRNA (adenosine(37)-N6)-threonylcarbamoyltransferase complex ATPase subunit type 1 TsaE [Tenuifilaceae bacterium]HRX68057.1 
MEPFVINSIKEIGIAAKKILNSVGSNRIVCFYGSMGAGKTTLIQEICIQMGVTDTVVSPTFALVNEYMTAAGSPVFHFDFYRINKIEEVFDFGYEEYFYSAEGICFIEWPELIEGLLPEKGVMRIKIDVLSNSARKFSILT